MKKAVLRIIIVLSIIIVFLSVVTLLYFLKFNSEIKKMSPLPTQFITDGIYSVKTEFVNFYIIQNDDNYIAIDAGNDIKLASIELKNMNIDIQKVTGVFLTHRHFDHIAALKLFKNAKIYISKIEGYNAKYNSNYIFLEDNQLIEINKLKIKCILTPGHTKGSMSYLINGKYLFIGDTMSLNNGHAELFNKFFNSNSEIQKQSIKKISLIPDASYIFTAHYGYSSDFKRCFEEWQ